MTTTTTDVTLVANGTGETLRVGPIIMHVLEDGSNTNNRLGAISLTIPPHTSGPPQHWHRMHDETFLVTKGAVRFTTGKKDVDAKAGDYIVVPPRAVHTFSNPFGEEAEFFNTFSPAYYVDYLRLTAKAVAAKGGPLNEKEARDIMAQFATFSPEGPEENVVE
jgi:mannose-6-phosphate isomerase-like protein (cupin superfamily)